MRRVAACGRAMAVVACLAAGARAQFVAPAEGPVAFRRDRLPLEVEMMAGLSQSVTKLVDGIAGTDAKRRRAAAQALALAMALDPSNDDARALLGEFEKGDHVPEATAVPAATTAEIWRNIAWLETPEAGTEGRSLAACLKDVMAVADPDHPRAAALREEGETGAWRGWVPDLAAYRPPKPQPKIPDPPAGDPPGVKAPKVALARAELLAPLWQRPKAADGTPGEWTLQPQPLELRARPLPDQPKEFLVTVGSAEPDAALPGVSELVTKLLKSRHPTLPGGVRLQITSRGLEQAVRGKKPTTVSAASFILAEAALRGKAPTGSVVATIDAEGRLGLPRGVWGQLRCFAGAPAGRLVAPVSAAEYLSSFLVLEMPGFFMDHQVLLASNPDELVSLTSAEPDPAVASVLAKFAEIQNKLGSQDLRLYIGNRFVKQRLAEIVQEAPWHCSARMLLTQALGNRPVTLARTVLAAELRRELRPLDEFRNVPVVLTNPNKLARRAGTVLDACRERLAPLERYVAREDRALFDDADRVLDALRDLERAPRSRDSDSVTALLAVQQAATTFQKLHQEYDAILQQEAGETPPEE